MFLVSCIFFNKCLYLSYYMAVHFLDRPHMQYWWCLNVGTILSWLLFTSSILDPEPHASLSSSTSPSPLSLSPRIDLLCPCLCSGSLITCGQWSDHCPLTCLPVLIFLFLNALPATTVIFCIHGPGHITVLNKHLWWFTIAYAKEIRLLTDT